jgi:hypothetical protein
MPHLRLLMLEAADIRYRKLVGLPAARRLQLRQRRPHRNPPPRQQ